MTTLAIMNYFSLNPDYSLPENEATKMFFKALDFVQF